MISGIYLGCSIYRIMKLITDKEDLVNTKIMTIHAAAFGIYMISTLIFVIIYLIAAYSGIHYKYDYISMADNINIFCSSIVQAMICYIFLNIDSIKPPVIRDNSEHDEVQVEEIDAHFDLQMRLWYQFMRDPDDIASFYQTTETEIAGEGSFIYDN